MIWDPNFCLPVWKEVIDIVFLWLTMANKDNGPVFAVKIRSPSRHDTMQEFDLLK